MTTIFIAKTLQTALLSAAQFKTVLPELSKNLYMTRLWAKGVITAYVAFHSS